MGNIRAKAGGSGSAEPNFSGSINDANVVGGIYHTSGWQNGAAWRVPTVRMGESAGPNMESVDNGIPVWDDASREFVTLQGRFSFSDFCDMHNVGEEDRAYLRYKLETAADGVRQNPYLDNVYVNCCPQWNPFIVLCKTGSKRLLVRGGKLLLRVRHAFQAVNEVDPPRGVSVSATAIPSPGTQTTYEHTLSVAFRRPYGLTATGGTHWVDYENFDKESGGWKYFVTGERVGADGIETFCTVAQLGEELNAIGELHEQRCTAGKTEASAQDPVAWLQAQPIFNSREDLQELVSGIFAPSISDMNLPGTYFDQNGAPLFVVKSSGFTSDALPSDEHWNGRDWERYAATPYAKETPALDPNIDLAEWSAWGSDPLKPVAATRSVQVPFIFRYNATGQIGDFYDIVRIVVDSGNTPQAAGDQFLYLAFFGDNMQFADGAMYGLYPADGGPILQDYKTCPEKDGKQYLSFKIPLSLFLEKTTIDGQECWSPGQHVVLDYYAFLKTSGRLENGDWVSFPFPVTKGSFHCGLEPGEITYPKQLPYAHQPSINASITDGSGLS